jgi:hypothetical protein
MGYVRVKPWTGSVAVAHPLTEQFVTPDRGRLYDENDPLVLAHPWVFATDAEIAEAQDGPQAAEVTEVAIDHAPENARKTARKPRG